MLYIDLRPGQTCHSKDSGSAYSIGVGKSGWQYGTGLKSHCTVTNWCTGREWPVNCMTVISVRRRSNMSFQDIEWTLNYYITECTGNWISWRLNAVEKASTQQRAVSTGLRLSNPGERERNADGHKSGGSICCSSVRSPTPSHTQPFQIKWELCHSSLLCVIMILHAYVDVYVLCVCIVNHGHGYTTIVPKYPEL